MTSVDMGSILHVDDEAPMRKAMAMLLSSAEYQVTSASNGRSALDLVAAGLCPDVLILDFHLGDEMDGADLAQRLRCELGYSPPIIMLTGDATGAESPWIVDTPIWLARKPLDAQLCLAALPGLVLLSRAIRDHQRRITSATAQELHRLKHGEH